MTMREKRRRWQYERERRREREGKRRKERHREYFIPETLKDEVVYAYRRRLVLFLRTRFILTRNRNLADWLDGEGRMGKTTRELPRQLTAFY